MHTVICAFDERADAERAMDSLAEIGFSREMMHLQVGFEAVAADSAAATPPASATAGAAAANANPGEAAATSRAEESPGLLQRVADFFNDLFGRDEVGADAGFYAEVIRRGGTVLVVDAVGEQEATRARTLMDRMGGTVDIDERAAQWRRGGWKGFDAQGLAEPPVARSSRATPPRN